MSFLRVTRSNGQHAHAINIFSFVCPLDFGSSLDIVGTAVHKQIFRIRTPRYCEATEFPATVLLLFGIQCRTFDRVKCSSGYSDARTHYASRNISFEHRKNSNPHTKEFWDPKEKKNTSHLGGPRYMYISKTADVCRCI